ncbi:type II secretion system protein, partial [Campylobacter canadensis]|uniref:type II secretion system protein n=1 Tax=Campylobacter canadensis TaxID=449520 RepID=UPI001CCA47B9
FTMIELIFVIVILGILAAVAIPKINATRDDAEQVKATQNIATLMGDFASFYTSQGGFRDSSGSNIPFHKITNVALDSNGNLKIKNEVCLKFEIADDSSIKITSSGSSSGNSGKKLCSKIVAASTLLRNTADGKQLDDGNEITIDYSASGINFDGVSSTKAK